VVEIICSKEISNASEINGSLSAGDSNYGEPLARSVLACMVYRPPQKYSTNGSKAGVAGVDHYVRGAPLPPPLHLPLAGGNLTLTGGKSRRSSLNGKRINWTRKELGLV